MRIALHWSSSINDVKQINRSGMFVYIYHSNNLSKLTNFKSEIKQNSPSIYLF